MDHVENLSVDGQHEQQRRQHPAEEVKINHVVHADDRLELAGHQEVVGDHGAVVVQALQIIPAEHRRKAHHDGHQPTQQHGRAGSPRGHDSLVATGKREDETLRKEISVI